MEINFEFKSWINGAKYSRMDEVKFVETAFKKFEGCLPQISLGPFLNTLSQVYFSYIEVSYFITFVLNSLRNYKTVTILC